MKKDLTDFFDPQTLVLTLIGNVPLIGEVVKDQIQAALQNRESERIQEAISILKHEVSKLSNKEFTPERKNQIYEICLMAFSKIKLESLKRKREIYCELALRSFQISMDPDKVDWFLKSIDRMSIHAVDALVILQLNSPRHRHQYHSHSGVIQQLEDKYTYAYLIALLRELQSLGVVQLDIDSSSLVGQNPRFTVFWSSFADEFLNFLKARNEH